MRNCYKTRPTMNGLHTGLFSTMLLVYSGNNSNLNSTKHP